MSLAVLADHMASKGRNGDSVLVHMTPGEVQALQALAERHGGTLTINPETGQPEANFLKKLLPAIAGFALGPAGFGLMSASMAGLTVGGITTLATGSLSRGIMAGLGAYGGAGLGEALTGAGTGAIAAGDIAAQQAAGTFPTLAEGATQAQVADYASKVSALRDTALQKAGEAGLGEKLSAGLGQIASNPAASARDLLKTGYAAATPIMAADTVKTTTPRGGEQTPSYIRPFLVDQYSQEMRALDPIDASQVRMKAAPGMADGGIVALADGGMSVEQMYQQYAGREADPGGAQYWAQQFGSTVDPSEASRFQTAIAEARAAGTEPAAPAFAQYTPQQINSYIAQNNLSGNALDAAIRQFNVDPNAVAAAQNMQNTISNVYQNVLGRDVDPSGLAYWTDRMTRGGASGQDMYNEFLLGALANKEIVRPGISLDEAVKPYTGYTSAESRNIADEWVRNALGREVTAADRQTDWYKQAQDAAIMNSYGAAQNIFSQFEDYARRTGGKDFPDLDLIAASQLLAPKTKKPPVPPITYMGGNMNMPGGAADGWTATTPATYAPPGTTNPYGNGVTPGDLTFNADGSVTVQPNIPGRPYGGFTGIQQLKNAYTAGGGSLGQSNLFAPKTVDEMYERYGTTGGSKQAYDYLMGKGAANVRKPVIPTAELMLPYAETMGLRRPTRFAMPKKPVKKDETASAPTQEEIPAGAASGGVMGMALGGLGALAGGGSTYNLGGYSDGGRLLRGPGDGVSDSIPATIGDKQPARLADGEFVVPARIVSELGNGSTEAGARKLYAMMDRVQKARGKTTGKGKVAANTRADKYLPA